VLGDAVGACFIALRLISRLLTAITIPLPELSPTIFPTFSKTVEKRNLKYPSRMMTASSEVFADKKPQ